MNSYDSLWIPTTPYSFRWHPMGFDKSIWVPLAWSNCDSLWVPMTSNEFLWLPMSSYDSLWVLIASLCFPFSSYDSQSIHLTPYEFLWLFMGSLTLCNSQWLTMAPYEVICVPMAHTDDFLHIVWQILTTHNPETVPKSTQKVLKNNQNVLTSTQNNSKVFKTIKKYLFDFFLKTLFEKLTQIICLFIIVVKFVWYVICFAVQLTNQSQQTHSRLASVISSGTQANQE